MAACGSCGARIVWAVTEKGNRMPVDADPNPAGNVIILAGVRAPGLRGDSPVVRVFANAEPTLGEEDISIDGKRYMPHHATCPNAADHRPRRTRTRRRS